jgi:hypothetical protein
VEPSSTDDSRLQGALPNSDIAIEERVVIEVVQVSQLSSPQRHRRSWLKRRVAITSHGMLRRQREMIAGVSIPTRSPSRLPDLR